jgi:hypothetical protein
VRLNQTVTVEDLDSTPVTSRNVRRPIVRDFLSEDERYTRALEERLTAMENKLQSQQTILRMQSNMNEDRTMLMIELQWRKRERSPVELPEAPILVEKLVPVKDNAHDVLCWEYKKIFRQVNVDPEDYWKTGSYPEEVKPNLKELVYWEHFMPMSLNPKVITYNSVSEYKIYFFTGTRVDA